MIEEIKKEIDERVNRLVREHLADLLTDSDNASFHPYCRYIYFHKQYVKSKILLHHHKKRCRDYDFNEDYRNEYLNVLRQVIHFKNLRNLQKKQLIFDGLLKDA